MAEMSWRDLMREAVVAAAEQGADGQDVLDAAKWEAGSLEMEG